MRAAIVVLCLLCCGTARADSNDLENWLLGPVVGVQLGGKGALVLGVEGGGGYGPERFNLGFEHRGDVDMVYIEADPWYLVGGTLGVGVQTDGKVQPDLGFWEAIPVRDYGSGCDGWRKIIVLSGGYRYTGIHELYLSLKAGWMNGEVCFD
jgi:hypothetical protein